MTQSDRPRRYGWTALTFVYRSGPRPFRALVPLTLVIGAGPSVVLWIGKVVIDEVARLSSEGAGTELSLTSSPTLLWAAIAFVLLQIALDGVGSQSDLQAATLRDQLEHASRSMLLTKISGFPDLALFEDPESLDAIETAEDGSLRLQQLANIAQNLMTGLFTFVPVLLLSLQIGWWVPALLALTSAPSIRTQLRYEERGWSLEQVNAPSYRRMALYDRTLTGSEYASELRLYGLRSLFLTRWSETFGEAYASVRRLRTRAAVHIFGWSVLSGLGAGLPYVFVLDRALAGRYSLGDIALLTGVVFELQRALQILVGSAASLQGVALGCRSFFRLMDLDSALVPGYEEAHTRECPSGSPGSDGEPTTSESVVFEDVTFSYPGTEGVVLSDVSFTLEPGSLTAIVGENGAGKTTIAKLLCRFYDPTGGSIRVGARDLRDLALGEWRGQIAIVGQEYARYAETLRDNVGFGDLSGVSDDERLHAAVAEAGMGATLERLPDGLDTLLSRDFPGGEELSGGQWQRVALARAVMARQDRAVVVLDEPTSSLDPNAEHEILATISRMAADRVAVVISHRLALARRASQILVLHDGRLVERGTHSELMERRGRYFDLFSKQASSYAGDWPQTGDHA